MTSRDMTYRRTDSRPVWLGRMVARSTPAVPSGRTAPAEAAALAKAAPVPARTPPSGIAPAVTFARPK